MKKVMILGVCVYLPTGLVPCSQAWHVASAQEMRIGGRTDYQERQIIPGTKAFASGCPCEGRLLQKQTPCCPLAVGPPMQAQPKLRVFTQQPRKGVV